MNRLYSDKDGNRVLVQRTDHIEVHFIKQNDTSALHHMEKSKFYEIYSSAGTQMILNEDGTMSRMKASPTPIGKHLGGVSNSIQNVSSTLIDGYNGQAFKVPPEKK